MDDKESYLKIGRASDLSGRDYTLYRFLEIFPGFLSWLTLLGTVVLSFYAPIIAAYFIIAFDAYWLLKTIYLSLHLRHNWKRTKYNISLNWKGMLSKLKHKHIVHLVVLPFYKESFAVVDNCLSALLQTDYNKKKMAIVLSHEERAGEGAKKIAADIQNKYKDAFGHFLVTEHPDNIPGEIRGKGSNISFAAEEARKIILDKNGVRYEDVIVSVFDIDTAAYSKYFLCLTWHFLTAPDPFKVSFQPVPFYNNNIWNVPAISRVAAGSSTFWQMMQQERPEKLSTFSSHSLAFKTLYDIGYWQKNMVSEDSRIFWNLFLANDGDYSVVPLSYPVSMDANVAPSLFETLKNIYKQHRRWAWGVENIPYMLFGFMKNQKITFWKKARVAVVQIEGFWSLATNPLIIFLLGWLPILIGGDRFNQTILSYNLPIVTKNMMLVAMAGLVLSAMIFISFLPPKPRDRSAFSKIFMALQWILIPLTITFFSAIPGLDAQTRLMFGKYLGFWVTPKYRKE